MESKKKQLKHILEKTADIWNDMQSLNDLHSSTKNEFMFHVYAIQNIIISEYVRCTELKN